MSTTMTTHCILPGGEVSVDVAENSTVATILSAAKSSPDDNSVVSLDGNVVPKDRLDQQTVKPDEEVFVGLIPAGG